MKAESPVTRSPDGSVSWEACPGDLYEVTGTLRDGRRLRPLRYSEWSHARGINLWRGSKWLVRGGKRYLIQSVAN